MPYQHANGCTCLTPMEALNKMGGEEGKTGGEILSEITEELGNDSKRVEDEIKSNPQWLFDSFLQDAEGIRDDEQAPMPAKILEVLDCRVSQKLSSGKTTTTMRVECTDGKIRKAIYWQANYSGSFYEPPESDCDITWIEIDEKHS